MSTLENVHLRKAFTMFNFLSNPSLIIAWLRSHPFTISGFGPLIDVTLNDEYATSFLYLVADYEVVFGETIEDGLTFGLTLTFIFL